MVPDDQTMCKHSALGRAQEAARSGRQRVSGKTAALLLVAGAYALGGGGMAAWLVFLFRGQWVRPLPGLGVAGSLLVDALLCLLFFVQHSVMVRPRYRLWLTRVVRVEFHGALYACASGACLLVLVFFWQPVGPPLWHPPAWNLWAMAGIYLLAAAGAWWGTRALGDFDALGIKSALGVLHRDRPDKPMAFVVRGPYRWIRHPLYFLSLIIIWSGPVYTLDRLLHNLLWSIWIVIGANYEERDLEACFGDAYRTYRQSVPMLLPQSVRPLVAASRRPVREDEKAASST